MDLTIGGIILAILWAIIWGLIAAAVAYAVLWLLNLILTISEATMRRGAAIVGALVALLVLVSRLGG